MSKGNRASKSSTCATRRLASGAHPGARHLAQSALAGDVANVSPDTVGDVVVYGDRGPQSRLADATLFRVGYSNVSSLAEGWRSWISEGGDIER
jgi:rhodanese-related sulfurtransferase